MVIECLDRFRYFIRFCLVSAISAHVGDIAIPAVDYSSDEEEEEGTDELTSLDTGSSDTSSVSSVGKQAILEEVCALNLGAKMAFYPLH